MLQIEKEELGARFMQNTRNRERGECTRVKKEDKELQREHKREDECS